MLSCSHFWVLNIKWVMGRMVGDKGQSTHQREWLHHEPGRQEGRKGLPKPFRGHPLNYLWTVFNSIVPLNTATLDTKTLHADIWVHLPDYSVSKAQLLFPMLCHIKAGCLYLGPHYHLQSASVVPAYSYSFNCREWSTWSYHWRRVNTSYKWRMYPSCHFGAIAINSRQCLP